MADFSKWSFFKMANSQKKFIKISWIGPWVSRIDQGPLITDGRKSNEMGFSKISFGRMTLAFQK